MNSEPEQLKDTGNGELNQSRFEEQAEQEEVGFVEELWQFLKENKKWWLLPLIGSLLLIGLISFFAASGAAPFIYTLF